MTDTVTATVTLRWRPDETVPHPALAPVPFLAARLTVQAEDEDAIARYARALAEADAAIGATHGIVDYTVQHPLSGAVLAHGTVSIDARNARSNRLERAMHALSTLANPDVGETAFREALDRARVVLAEIKKEG